MSTAAVRDISTPRTAHRQQLRTPSLSAVVGMAVTLVGAYIGSASLGDNSFFTHLATGRHILEHGFPTGDVYSFTAPGQRWVVQSWLVSVVYAVLDRTVGLVGIRAFTAVLAGAVAASLWVLTRPAKGLVARLAISVVVLALGATIWSPRPLMVGLALLGATLLVAERRLPPWLLLPAFWLWVNSHGSFPLGLLALACLAVGSRLDGERRPQELRPLAWAVGGTVLGAVNPLGPVLLTFPLGLLRRQDSLRAVVEWQSPSFSTTYGRVFLVLVLMAVAALVRRPSWRSAVPLAVFLAAGLLATRNLPVAALVMTPGIARGAEGLGSLTGDVRNRTTAVLACLVIVVGGLAISQRMAEPDLDLRDYPVDAVAWMDQQGLVGPDVRVAHSDVVGNYLELVLGDRANVFSDDRVDMYPQALVDDELTLIRATPEWRSVLDRWDIDAVLWERGAPVTQFLADSAAWRLAYADQRWMVYERR